MRNFLLVLTALALLTSCAQSGNAQSEKPAVENQIEDRFTGETQGRNGISIITDNEEGCQYLSVYGKAVTPLMGRNGQQICR